MADGGRPSTYVSPLLFVAAPAVGAALAALWWMPSHVGGTWWATAAMWVGGVSIFAFLAFVADKIQARLRWWRTSEDALLWTCAMGGLPGALLAMLLARHKIGKPRFVAFVFLLGALQLGAFAAWWRFRPLS